ncbi:Uu.00g003530.m01.CDS01 [Anthostomella pinea]|uniref:Uu.00g003530.m01.CDS01 n=1 Tax=Anthostomella pinea TaxID=933095 RepID=A0AAI8VJV5_9PEZI|nr:Uu.00g003530.m01.CDS01 [Anthostomella pinea]
MTSAVTPSKPAPHHQQMSPPQQQSHPSTPTSPPSKRDLKSWWKRFQVQSRHHETTPDPRPQGIFGVPLRQSITYANVAISLVDEHGQSYIYGYVPIVVAKCGVFLKEKATGIEGIFRLSGSEKRIKELKIQFDSPNRYGKGLVWEGYTVHDAANVLRRYLNDLPEPVVPLDLYERFRDPLRGHTRQAVGDAEGTQLVENFDEAEAIDKYQQLIKDLPPLNRQLLLYILDLLAVFAAKADENRMTAQNLAAIFQPGMLSHPHHAMAPEEYRLNQCVIIFLIENQDHFLIGMQGTGTDEQTKQDIEKGNPRIVTPATPSRSSGVARTASNASAAAESVSRDGMIRRNRSVSSRHSRQSRQSNGASTPGSPSITTPSCGLGRSNTVPSKKSPHIPSGRFPQRQNSPTVAVAPASPSPTGPGSNAPSPMAHEAFTSPERSPATSSLTPVATGSTLMPGPHVVARSQERLLGSPGDTGTPLKERNLQSLFQRSPTSDSDKRQPNKLRKKRIPSSANPSAQSSTASLPHSGAVSPALESPNPFEQKPSQLEPISQENGTSAETPSEPTPRASQVPSAITLPAASDNTSNRSLKPKSSPPTSLHSSFNEGSDIDHSEEAARASSSEMAEKEKKRRWRISRRKEEMSGSPVQNLGLNSHAEMSTSTVGSGHRARKSMTGDYSDVAGTFAESETGSREKDDSKGPLGWIKNKYREAKENAEHKRTKSPPDHGHGFLPTRSRSVDIKRSLDEKRAPTSAPAPHGPSPIPESAEAAAVAAVSPATPAPEDVPLPNSPPPVQTTHERPPNP